MTFRQFIKASMLSVFEKLITTSESIISTSLLLCLFRSSPIGAGVSKFLNNSKAISEVSPM